MPLNPIIPQLKTWVGKQDRLSHEPEGPEVDISRITQVQRVLSALDYPYLDWTLQEQTEVLDYLARVTYRTGGSGEAYQGSGDAPTIPGGVDLSQYVKSVNGNTPDPTTGNVVITIPTPPPSTFSADIPVVLRPGRTFGKYVNGDVIPATGKTPQEVIVMANTDFLLPSFDTFTINGSGNQEVETGILIAGGNKTFGWSTSNSGNIIPNTVGIYQLLPTSATLVQGLANDGVETLTLAGFTATLGIFLSYQIAALPTQGAAITRTITFTGRNRAFYGTSTSDVTTSSQVRALSSSFLIQGGGTYILNTGTVDRRFAFWTTRTLVSALDLDALNADITSQYVGVSLSVNDAGGTPVLGTRYQMTQAVPYSSNHRHQLTFS